MTSLVCILIVLLNNIGGERDENNITKTIDKELNGWDNLHTACTRGVKNDLHSKDEYMMAGTTKDNLFVFSILCIN